MKKLLRSLVCLGFVSSVGHSAVTAVFSKDCQVFSKPSFTAVKACRRERGQTVTASKAKSGFVQIQSEGCTGFVPIQCLAKAERANGNSVGSASASGSSSSESTQGGPIYLGVVTGFDGLWGRVPYSSTLSKGLGLNLGAELNWVFHPAWHLIFRPSYQYLRLGRPVDGSGSLSDPNPTNFDQSLHCLGIGIFTGFLVEGRDSNYSSGEPQWWVDGGFEFVYPFSAKQTAQSVGDLKITADKMLLLVIGPSVDFELSNKWLLSGALETFYNLLSKEQGRLFGVRAKVALDFNL